MTATVAPNDGHLVQSSPPHVSGVLYKTVNVIRTPKTQRDVQIDDKQLLIEEDVPYKPEMNHC